MPSSCVFSSGKKMSLKPFIIAFFLPNAGCPHRCVFCNQTSITGCEDGRLSPQHVREGIDEFLSFKDRRWGSVEVAFYGGNFLGLKTSYIQSLLDEAQGFVKKGFVDSIRFSTRPDTVNANALKTIAPYTIGAIELGAQSMDDTVLSMSRRGHTAKDTTEAVRLLKEGGLRVGLQIMPGLPGDSLESILETGRRVAELKPEFVRIYPTVVVKNTVLEKWYRQGRFTPLSLADAIEVTKRLYLFLEAQGISVIRMGLHAAGTLVDSSAVVAGPFHPAFGHLVHSAIFLDIAADEIESKQGPSKRVALKVRPRDVSKAIGLKRDNIKRLVQRFHLEELQVLADPTVPENTVRVENVLA
jgi:histone acetyltransferase (RNA polymerase elongator complex component)